MHTGSSPLPARPEGRLCEKSGLSSDRETAAITRAASGLDASTLPTPIQTASPDPEVCSGYGPNVPVHSSTPNRANTSTQPSWTEVVRRSSRRVSAGPYPQPPLAISNRFTILPEGASVHPDATPAVSTSSGSEVTSAAPATSHGKASRRSSAVNDRRRLLKEAMIRRSGGLPGASLKQTTCPPAQTTRSGLSTCKPRKAAPMEGLQHCPDGPHISSPRPLFPPTTLIIGDSITRDIRFINAATHCLPGATVPHILDKLLEMMHSLPTSIKRIIVHVGTNDTTHSCELTVDTNSVNRKIKLSDNNRKMTCVEEYQSYPDHPDRFDYCPQLLCRTGLTGRCYWEVEWRRGLYISVSYRRIRRKGGSGDCVFGRNDQSWSLFCSDGRYSVWHNNRSISSSSSSSSSVSHRVAVYVDCPAGSLSFYRVCSDTLIHLHTFNTTFTEPLYPGFGLRWWSGSGSSVSLCGL
ncbi:Stonustoxin subunit alpha [Nibea albiflora]|uniref:Stonustoxin subunit alpha n=1 Tax=Nibea albiflora TaxID=240163 RepID=A0ACB7ER91_NIBAL|nr:Stonustoxin subunit alpha [Nibea albiflora]